MAAHQAWYEESMVRLAMLVSPYRLDEVERSFKAWVESTLFPLPFAFDYCLDRGLRGLSLPWEDSDAQKELIAHYKAATGRRTPK